MQLILTFTVNTSTVEYIMDRTKETLVEALTSVINLYRKRGFKVMMILAYPEFMAMKENIERDRQTSVEAIDFQPSLAVSNEGSEKLNSE